MEKLEGRWLAGISGGPDSMALLNMCLESHTDVIAAHVNYHHRREADEEEQYVRFFCREHQIPCVVRNEPFGSEGNFEADAREWRYSFFLKMVRTYHLNGVLIAHQEDDLLETYLMQEERHLIPSWYGLKEKNDWHGMIVYRPLLAFTKQELQEYCDQKKIRYYIDSTNSDESITRNRIRHQTVENMPRAERNRLLQEIQKKNDEKTGMEKKADALIARRKISLPEYRKLSESQRDTLLRRLIEKEDPVPHLSLAYVQEMDSVLMRKNDFIIPVKETNLVQEAGCLMIRSPFQPYCDVYASLSDMKDAEKERYRIEKGEPGIYACSVGKEDFPITIRNFEVGDTIRMRFGRKSVHRFFIDRHIPLYARDTWPVVLNRKKEVILVPGLGCDVSHYTVTPDFNVIECRLPEGEK